MQSDSIPDTLLLFENQAVYGVDLQRENQYSIKK